MGVYYFCDLAIIANILAVRHNNNNHGWHNSVDNTFHNSETLISKAFNETCGQNGQDIFVAFQEERMRLLFLFLILIVNGLQITANLELIDIYQSRRHRFARDQPIRTLRHRSAGVPGVPKRNMKPLQSLFSL